MSYTDLRDFACEYSVPAGEGVVVQVEKLGGGTVGKAYTGTWRYIVTRNGQEVRRGQDFESGTELTHFEAAWIIACSGGYVSDDDAFLNEDHADYPHHAGALPDCPACESHCHCGEQHDEGCQPGGMYEHPMTDGKLYHATQCVWSGHSDED
jgi:hypothetical protein